ncbi:zinc finger protein 99-like isoform X1 [Centruroides sculpturatus]|uniref:zinc finger protein 99-like isoform X1 n=2 Tax=Centruroides sculpturatus TaxID=218467 RepID=UPI000C6D6B19|nr:zinc finger protein 99-like isoform X1 [Centruroides sculpturatus]
MPLLMSENLLLCTRSIIKWSKTILILIMESEFQQSFNIRDSFGCNNAIDCKKEEINKNYSIKSDCRVVLKRLNIKVKIEDCSKVHFQDEYLKLTEKNKFFTPEKIFNEAKIQIKEKEQSEKYDNQHYPKTAKCYKYKIDGRRYNFSNKKFDKIQMNIKKKYFKVMCTSLSKEDFMCNLCTQMFTNYKVLRAHLFFHVGNKPFHCTTCNRMFYWEFLLRRHRKEHEIENQIQIDNKKFELQSSSKYLLEPVEQWKPFQCDICGKRVMTFSRLEMHHKTHSSYTCKICEKEFRQESHLRNHLIMHSEDRPFKCDICNKRFKTKCNWKYRKAVHSDKSDYRCELCKASFKAEQPLSNHMEKHSKYDYSCEICNRPFKSNNSLCNHRARHGNKCKYF